MKWMARIQLRTLKGSAESDDREWAIFRIRCRVYLKLMEYFILKVSISYTVFYELMNI